MLKSPMFIYNQSFIFIDIYLSKTPLYFSNNNAIEIKSCLLKFPICKMYLQSRPIGAYKNFTSTHKIVKYYSTSEISM